MIDIEREQLISLEHAAKRCGVCIKTMRNYADGSRKPRLETTRSGTQIRTTANALNKWLAACERLMNGTENRPTRPEPVNAYREVESLKHAHGI